MKNRLSSRPSAVSKRLRNILRRQGMGAASIEQVVSEAIGGKEDGGLKKLPRIITGRILRLLGNPGNVAVICRGRGLGIRVFSLAGYKSLVKQGHVTGTQNMKRYQERQAASKSAKVHPSSGG